MITPDKKTKKKNILTAVAILAFMVFLFVFTLYKADMSFSGTCVFPGRWEAPLRPMFATMLDCWR